MSASKCLDPQLADIYCIGLSVLSFLCILKVTLHLHAFRIRINAI